MKTIGFFINTTKPATFDIVPATIAWLRKQGIQSLVASDEAKTIGLYQPEVAINLESGGKGSISENVGSAFPLDFDNEQVYDWSEEYLKAAIRYLIDSMLAIQFPNI